MTEIEAISKMQAAERQLRVAVQLFFERRDLVAVQTLVAAAFQVLRDVGTHRGVSSPLRDSDYIQPNFRTEFERILKRAPNFLKHADRDPDDVLEFRPLTIPFELVEAMDMYGRLEGRWIPETLVFFAWFARKNPDLFILEGRETIEGLSGKPSWDIDDFVMIRSALERFRREEQAGRWPPHAPTTS